MLSKQWLLRLLPHTDYFCPKCYETIEKNTHKCPYCKTNFPFNFAIKAPSKILSNKKALSKYVHDKIFPGLSENHREFLTMFFTVFFSEDWESGSYDTNNWAIALNGTGTDLTVQSTIKHAGTYAIKSVMPDVAGAWALLGKDNYGSSYTDIYYEDWVRFDALPDTEGDILLFLAFIDSSWSVDTGSVIIGYSGGVVKWGMQYSTNSTPNTYSFPASSPAISANTWYKIKIRIVNGNGTGAVYIWVNDVLVHSVTGLTNNNYASQYPYVGAEFKGGSWAVNVYHDDLNLSDEAPSPTIFVNESGSGSETSKINFLVNESGSGVETSLIKLPITDNCTGSEVSLIKLPLAESVNASENTNINMPLNETGQGIEAHNILGNISILETGNGNEDSRIILPSSETALGNEDTNVAATIPISDSASANELSSINVLINDSGDGVEIAKVSIPIGDVGVGNEQLTLTVSINLSDSGQGLENVITQSGDQNFNLNDETQSNEQVTINVTVTATETSIVSESITVKIPINDYGAGNEQLGVSANIPVDDSGFANEITSLLLNLTDSGVASESSTIQALISLFEQGVSAESVELQNLLSLLETGTAIEQVVVGIIRGLLKVTQTKQTTSLSENILQTEIIETKPDD